MFENSCLKFVILSFCQSIKIPVTEVATAYFQYFSNQTVWFVSLDKLINVKLIQMMVAVEIPNFKSVCVCVFMLCMS